MAVAAAVLLFDRRGPGDRTGKDCAGVGRCGFPQPDAAFSYDATGARIEYREIGLEQPRQRFNVEHALTTQGVEEFAADYRATVYPKAG